MAAAPGHVVAIRVNKVGDGFSGEMSAPDGEWHSTTPLTPTDLLERLSALGCHSTAATDALDESGAD